MTANTAMTDGANERLDAQIAEALFGQPGMSKMDVANRVRELRGDGPALLADVQPGGRVRLGDQAAPSKDGWNVLARIDTAIGYLTTALDDLDSCPDRRPGIMVTEAMTVLRETLAAQPSPGGQDALAEAARRVIRDIDSGDYHGEISEATYGALKAALAARQPVGQITDTEIDARLNALYREMVDSGQHNGGMSGVAWDRAVYRMAASQPGGQEPVTVEAVATVRRDGEGDRYVDWLTEGGIADLEVGDVLIVSDRAITDEDGSGEVYAAPPAQALDQGRWSQGHAEDLEQAIHTALSAHAGSLSQKKRKAISDYVKRLLIDGKAVGNG
ncbi:hypothetical protein ERT44_05325 [Stenotrophomonas sp. MA5]|uniref:hypothetical protein n=1 Tax=Stenotrophomonas sp. MA5 TaxID=2508572 RepID=UPI001009B995|nr:hypothetical protein [Stenotrophomonas sp. MA5]RXK68641.1 hypothetical protein ERT44_05325 [Stenotrophomonas sp. MA5]